jgi:site-specific DNA recombinase
MKKSVYGYTRVSTAKQGEGVSLAEQKSSIETYALKHNLQIVEWFEEKQTAAKRGRPVFTKMLKLLKKKKAEGLVIHKIDRSARNLRDWSDLGDLMETGIDIHFSFEAIDFNTRGGRLSADIQAVIAADYIRNLREETKKGLYGRLKQGLYPYAAPIGYLNMGGGKPKEIDPVRGPLIKELFQLYATGLYGIIQLAEIMYEKGLRNTKDGIVCRKRISTILNNPFYFGVIQIFRTGETYQGIHAPLISKELFGNVQDVLNGKRHHSKVKREFLYRRCIQCGSCKKSLVAENQKGHVYYRCKAENCPTKTVREEFIDNAIGEFLGLLKIPSKDVEDLCRLFVTDLTSVSLVSERKKRDCQLELSQIEKRIQRLTDKFVDDLIDQPIYNKTRCKWLFRQTELNEQLAKLKRENEITESQFMDFLNWTGSLKEYYAEESAEQKRVLLKTLSPNLSYSAGKLSIEPYSPYLELANANHVHHCDLATPGSRNTDVTLQKFATNSAVEYELIKTSDEKFSVSRLYPNSVPIDKNVYLSNLVQIIKDNPAQCHDVTREIKTL